MSHKKVILSLIAAVSLSACVKPTTETPPISAVDEKIAEAVDKASTANVAIAEVEVATSAPKGPAPGSTIPPNVVLPAEAIQPVTVDWNGPVEEFLKGVADRAGYELVITGDVPPNAVMITMSAKNEPLFGVIRRAGNIVHGYADIGFNPARKKIELRYGS